MCLFFACRGVEELCGAFRLRCGAIAEFSHVSGGRCR